MIAMSQWFARQLVDNTGLPAAKVHVVHPGATAVSRGQGSGGEDVVRRERPRRRLLFVGRDFQTKGGDLVVDAVARPAPPVGPHRDAHRGRSAASGRCPERCPQGVRFLGPVGVEAVAALMDSHDLLVMPSRLEGFGIVFVEALARGLPCIGRRDFAMPEIIEDGRTGRLLAEDDVDACGPGRARRSTTTRCMTRPTGPASLGE